MVNITIDITDPKTGKGLRTIATEQHPEAFRSPGFSDTVALLAGIVSGVQRQPDADAYLLYIREELNDTPTPIRTEVILNNTAEAAAI